MDKKRVKFWWSKPWLWGFWAVLSAFALMLIAQVGAEVINSSQAAISDTTGGGIGFEDYLFSAIDYANVLVGALAALTVVLAGFTYMTSSGSKEGISTAKSMIVAAITGVLLYAFGRLLLGGYGPGAGGLITNFFSGNPIRP